ncbi:MAG: DUF599 domain-containing protein [gamma proteobacterium symbiont of Bathyaustriella thionipta]|nr:DUF599 domain-containing protein [gamma proteobacterium symbiont of Bathyaustriella thionipta]MCU7949436.1 DUF599 domain-containing protein [gamma proteobacterium symbiont of Bathyaustriella thionipta]MCU7954038.1 DUF599 domain-containing protein [gamma proteobacterium symbiont of Bathyaustriella thionipta]MCU7956023.1 DUF599 domain-containing protein [gamma proteobacterium symbiont of Bathyaustriella thionipta]MCU7966229.1 DUF599 domain-containing protein [gamma proteobacterium symbiont of 
MLINTEFLIATVTFGLFFGYHLWHFFQIKHSPLSTSTGFNNKARSIWIKHVRENALDILAIQTLRNWTMAATFLASTALLLALALLNFALTTDGLNEIAHEFNFLGSQSHHMLLIKALFLTADFMFGFISFVLAVRYYNHASFLINIPENYHLSINSESDITAINQGAFCYNLGMRAYYFSIPLIFWMLGPAWMLLCALIVTFVVYKLDHGI